MKEYCICCLSRGRKLWPLAIYSQLLKKMINKKIIQLKNASVCWECHAVLRNISKYVYKVNQAQDILAKYGESFNAKSLSRLSIYKNIKDEIKIESNELNSNVQNINCPIVNHHPEDVDSIDNCQIKTEEEDAQFKIERYGDPFSYIEGVPGTEFIEVIKDEHKIIDIEQHNNDCNNVIDDVNDNLSIRLKNENADIEIDTYVTNYFATDNYDHQNDNDVEDTNTKVDRVIVKKTRRRISNGKKFTRVVRRNWAAYVQEMTMEPHELDYWRIRDKEAVIYKQRMFKCELCIMAWSIKTKMTDHIRQYHQKKTVHFCDTCKCYFYDKFRLTRHVKSHYCLFKCKLCGEITHTRDQIQFHFAHKHRIVYTCVACSHTFESLQSINDHYKEMHGRFICDYCERECKTKNHLTKHIFAKHIFCCKSCKKYFKTSKQLQYHNSVTHETVRDETAFCVECNKQFTSVNNFKHHVTYTALHCKLSGRPSKKHPCSGCNKVYSRKLHLTRHYNFVHLKKNDFYCKECDKNFLKKVNFLHHNKVVHEGIKLVPIKNKFCNICGRGFSENRILLNHIRTHTGERPFECEQCPLKFAQKVALRSHMRNIHKNS